MFEIHFYDMSLSSIQSITMQNKAADKLEYVTGSLFTHLCLDKPVQAKL